MYVFFALRSALLGIIRALKIFQQIGVATLILAGVFLFYPRAASQPAPTSEPPAPAVLNPTLIPVCSCESTGKKYGTPTQWDEDGNVLHGRINHNDIGMCQINVEPRNGNIQKSIELGFDVYTEQGNIKYANWLYEHAGLTPWNWSKGCWQ